MKGNTGAQCDGEDAQKIQRLEAMSAKFQKMFKERDLRCVLSRETACASGVKG